jgi:hypothetical protein
MTPAAMTAATARQRHAGCRIHDGWIQSWRSSRMAKHQGGERA